MLSLATMKKSNSNDPVTRGVLDEAVEAILSGMQRMFSKQDKRFDKLEAGQKDMQRQINDLKYDTPSQKEFNTLKSRVDNYHPLT